MPKGKLLTCFVFTLLTGAVISAQSPHIGATVRGADYDSGRGVTTVHIVNTSGKVITFFHMPYILTFPDGTESLPGQHQMGLELLPYLVSVKLSGQPVEGLGTGGIQPGATYDYQFTGRPGPVRATVDLVAYDDGTADVLNETAFKELIANRKGTVRALRKANELLNIALADPTVQHPSSTVAAQLRALATEVLQQKYSDGVGGYASELRGAAQNIENKFQSSAGRSELENSQLRGLIKTHQDTITLMVPHAELNEVRP
jgi:hypothetical protein